MDPATAAVMLILTCTPDTLLCRRLPQHAEPFDSVSGCERMLPVEIKRLSSGDNRIIGRCQAVASSDGWAKLPDSTLSTALQRDTGMFQDIPASARTDQTATGSTPEPMTREDEPGFLAGDEQSGSTVVRVTRMISGSPVTTAYLVDKD